MRRFTWDEYYEGLPDLCSLCFRAQLFLGGAGAHGQQAIAAVLSRGQTGRIAADRM